MASLYLRSFSLQRFLLLLAFRPHLLGVHAQTLLSPEELRDGIDHRSFDAILDVRTEEEWHAGHLPTATHVPDLPSATLPPFPDTMGGAGCNRADKVVVVYCRSGARAGAAIERLIAAGYEATLYNGRGTAQWTRAGYELVDTGSATPFCSRSKASKASKASSKASKTKMSKGKTPKTKIASHGSGGKASRALKVSRKWALTAEAPATNPFAGYL